MTVFNTSLRSKRITGKPCKKCGSTLRYASTKSCVKCNEAKYRRYKEANRDQGKIGTAQANSIRKRQNHSLSADDETRYRGFPGDLKGLEFPEMMAAMKVRLAAALERAS
jgi:uncharacterized OB-fold protein